MVWEAQIGFIIFYFFCWSVMALVPWSGVAIVTRGRGALLALPLALGAAWAAGIAVPLVGLTDATGFVLSLVAAVCGSVAGSFGGVWFWRRMQASRPAAQRPVMTHPTGSRRPIIGEAAAAEPVKTAPADD